MIVYALEFALIHSLFYLVYKLLLTNETQLNFRRFFLLGSTLLSLTIPLIDIPTSAPIATFNLAEMMITQQVNPSSELIWVTPWYIWLIGGIGGVILLKLFFGLGEIGHWYNKSVAVKLYKVPVRKVDKLQNSFTFLRWIFIDPNHFQNDEAVVRHEWGHSQHLHSIDVLFFNLLAVPFWWMPSIWFMLQEAKKVHEYQADQYALKSTETQSYIKTLVHSTMKCHGMNLASSFDDTPIVKRLKFMKKMKRKMNPWKMGSIAAIMAITGLVFACDEEVKEEIRELDQERPLSEEEIAEISAQDVEMDSSIDEIFTTVDKKPQFPDGLYSYIASNLKYPEQARKMGIEGRVFIQFVVEKDGSISNVLPVKGIGAGCDAEAVRAMKGVPNFSPGLKNGKAVRVQMTLPIVFKLDGDK